MHGLLCWGLLGITMTLFLQYIWDGKSCLSQPFFSCLLKFNKLSIKTRRSVSWFWKLAHRRPRVELILETKLVQKWSLHFSYHSSEWYSLASSIWRSAHSWTGSSTNITFSVKLVGNVVCHLHNGKMQSHIFFKIEPRESMCK